MTFSIVTPSFRQSEWLRLCVASVADQHGVSVEHIVQDACSDDGTQDWLPSDRRVRAFVEKDAGMYDAVNRGIRRAEGEIVAYLNCDEQYLPGTLEAVGRFFSEHPGVDILIADVIVTDAAGAYLCHRVSMVPIAWHLWTRFNVTTSSLFIRRTVFSEGNHWFDSRWRDLGDFFWIHGAIQRRLHWAELRMFASVFTETGENMNLKPNAERERREKCRMAPLRARALAPLARIHHQLRTLVRGAHTQQPFSYALYTLKSPAQRVVFQASKPTTIWRR